MFKTLGNKGRLQKPNTKDYESKHEYHQTLKSNTEN